MSTPIVEVYWEKGEVSTDLKSTIEEVSTRLEDLKFTIEQVSADQKDIESAIEEVSTHQKDLKSAIEEMFTHLKESNPPLKMSTPTEEEEVSREKEEFSTDLKSSIEEVAREKGEVSTDLKSTIEEVSTHLKESNPSLKMSTPTEEVSRAIEEVSAHLKKFNFEDWISKLGNLNGRLYNFVNQHFPSTIEQRIADIEHQIGLCIKVLESVPQEKRELTDERAIFAYLYGSFYDAIPEVYNKEAERLLAEAIQLNPCLWGAWFSLGNCAQKRGDFHRAEECFQIVVKMNKEDSFIFRQLAFFELQLAQVSKNPAQHIEESIKYAKRELDLGHMDGICIQILGCAYLDDFRLTGGWDQNNLQLALKELKKAKILFAEKPNPYLEYSLSLVNRFLENYKMSLDGFSKAASMNSASDALHQMKVTLQLLDKFEELLQGTPETSLSAQIHSLASIDLNPLYNRATMDLLAEGPNKRIAVIAAVQCLVKYEYKAPVYYMLLDSDENSFVLAVFGIQKEAIKQGDQVTLLEPICKFVDFEWKGKHYQFKSVRVNLLEQVLVNGNPLPLNSAMREP